MKKIFLLSILSFVQLSTFSQEVQLKYETVNGHKFIATDPQTMAYLLDMPIQDWKNLLNNFDYPDKFVEDNCDWASSGTLLGQNKYAVIKCADKIQFLFTSDNSLGFSESPLAGFINKVSASKMFLRSEQRGDIKYDIYAITITDVGYTYYFTVSRKYNIEICFVDKEKAK